MCYVTLENQNGEAFSEGSTFDICEQEAVFLNQTVRLTYGVVNINDCESIEPCGKTREENIITDMTVIN